MEEQKIQFQVILPNNHPLKGLIESTQIANTQFLVGYRNILTKNNELVQWGLVKSQGYCAKSFVFSLQQQKIEGLNYFCSHNETIERVGNNFIFLKVDNKIENPSQAFSLSTVQKLLQQIGGINKISLNILKNSFNSFAEFNSLISKQTIKSLGLLPVSEEIQGIDKIKIEYNSKDLSGQYLKKLPTTAKQTGDWIKTETIELKIIEY